MKKNNVLHVNVRIHDMMCFVDDPCNVHVTKTGSVPALFMAVYVYLADNTQEDRKRSYSMVVAQVCLFEIKVLVNTSISPSLVKKNKSYISIS